MEGPGPQMEQTKTRPAFEQVRGREVIHDGTY